MKIYVDSITIDNQVKTMEVPTLDPEWRWTAANGVEYHVEDGTIEPEPDHEIIDHGCGNPECCHSECWSEEVLRAPGTGERIKPRMIKVTRQVPISTRIYGSGRVEGDDEEELARAIEWPGCWSLDEPSVVRGPDVADMRGQFVITRVHKMVDGFWKAEFKFQNVVKER